MSLSPGRRSARSFAPLIWVVLILAVAGFGAWRMRRPASVAARPAQWREVIDSVSASGRIYGDLESDVGAIGGGRVARLLVREGDRVTAGQALAVVESAGLERAREQSEAALGTADAGVGLARRRALSADVDRVRQETARATSVARARLSEAERRLADLQAGATPEELAQAGAQVDQQEAQGHLAEAQLRQAQATLAQARRDRDRADRLVQLGAISAAEADRTHTTVEVAEAAAASAGGAVEAARTGVRAAAAKLAQLRVGTRTEVVAQARAAVEAARADLAGAARVGAAQLAALNAAPRREDVNVAAARYREARSAVVAAGQRLRDSQVTAPFDGTVTKLYLEAGGVTGPGQPVVRLVRTGRLEVRADVDENNLARIRVGQSAVISAEALPGERMDASVTQIGAQVDSERGTFEVRLRMANASTGFRPGQTVSANIVMGPPVRRLVVPVTAVQTVGLRSNVLVVEAGRVVEREVRLGPPGPDAIPVLDGLAERDLLIPDRLGFAAGQSVAVQQGP